MKTKNVFYAVFCMLFVCATFLTTYGATQVSDAVAVSSFSSYEGEETEEEYEDDEEDFERDEEYDEEQ